jgi:hypothetical protein
MVLINGRRKGWSRPVALPDDVDDPSIEKAHGIIQLPLHVFWSGPGPDKRWNLDDRRQRLQVYEMVLTEGNDDDVRAFIDIDELLKLWPDLWLSPHVRQAWASHLRKLRSVDLGC